MSELPFSPNERRLLILAPTQKDAEATKRIFCAEGIESYICKDIAELCREMESGAAAMVVTQEAIFSDAAQDLHNALKNQPPWSDYPLIVLTPAGIESPKALKDLESVGHMTFIKRPVQLSTLF